MGGCLGQQRHETGCFAALPWASIQGVDKQPLRGADLGEELGDVFCEQGSLLLRSESQGDDEVEIAGGWGAVLED